CHASNLLFEVMNQVIEMNRFLLACAIRLCCAQPLYACRVVFQLVLAEDHCRSGSAGVSTFELRLKAAGAGVYDNRKTGIAQELSRFRSLALGSGRLVNEINLAFGRRRKCGGLLAKVQKALHPDGKADRRRRLSTQQLQQSVIPSPAAY